jgi:hypothetical protein
VSFVAHAWGERVVQGRRGPRGGGGGCQGLWGESRQQRVLRPSHAGLRVRPMFVVSVSKPMSELDPIIMAGLGPVPTGSGNEDKARLVNEETRQKGATRWGVYLAYFSACGSHVLVCCLGLSLAFTVSDFCATRPCLTRHVLVCAAWGSPLPLR